MRNILLAFDGQHFSEGVVEFAKHLNKQQPIQATGIFLPSIDLAEILYSFGGVLSGPIYIDEVVTIDENILYENISRFVEFCKQNAIEYKVHAGETKNIIPQIVGYTRFADALVLSSSSFYSNLGKASQHDHIANALHKSECPVVLIPGQYHVPKSIVMAYDGSEQSVFAIKQFTYLFPEFKDTQVLLMYFDPSEKAIPERTNVEDFMRLHYSNVTISKMKIEAKKYLETWLLENGDTLLVAGAYGRSLLSEMLKKSFIEEVILDHKIPVFIAHK